MIYGMSEPLIYAVDDEESIRRLYEESLPLGGFSVKTASDADELYALLSQKDPDLLLLDVMLEGEDGFSILSKLREEERYAAVPIIMVSAKGSEIDKVNGLNLGADDYISKPFGVLELLARIRANLRRSALKPTVFEYKDIRFDMGIRKCYIKGEEVVLTKTEFDLLVHLMQKQGNVSPKEEILSCVWGADTALETRTLDIHVSNLRKKIQGSDADLVTVRGIGYALR